VSRTSARGLAKKAEGMTAPGLTAFSNFLSVRPRLAASRRTAAMGAAAVAKASVADAGEALPSATGTATNSAGNAKSKAANFFSFTGAFRRCFF
jgi:hypothetical protein